MPQDSLTHAQLGIPDSTSPESALGVVGLLNAVFGRIFFIAALGTAPASGDRETSRAPACHKGACDVSPGISRNDAHHRREPASCSPSNFGPFSTSAAPKRDSA